MGQDFSAVLENSVGWQEIVASVANGRVPQSVAAIVPSVAQPLFVESYARLLLSEEGWSEGKHPDLIYAGSNEKAPSIEECRGLNEELALHPVSAMRRLAVIWSADKLSLEAENSLLKLTEEPPANGCILFVCQENRLLPTIKSRVWSVNIDLPDEYTQAIKAPSTPMEWARWIEKSSTGKKSDTETVFLEMQGWIKYYTEHGEYKKASDTELIIKLSKLRNMSLSMIEDIAFTVLQEGINCEKIFGGLR